MQCAAREDVRNGGSKSWTAARKGLFPSTAVCLTDPAPLFTCFQEVCLHSVSFGVWRLRLPCWHREASQRQSYLCIPKRLLPLFRKYLRHWRPPCCCLHHRVTERGGEGRGWGRRRRMGMRRNERLATAEAILPLLNSAGPAGS